MLDFFTYSCALCVKFAPTYDRVAADLSGFGVTFAKVDLNKNPGLKKRFSIKTYPRLILLDNTQGSI
jgi:thiol-disulfide isomerase/thioredoxin